MMIADECQRKSGRKKDRGGDAGRLRQEVGRTRGAEQAARRARTERSPHICPFAVLQQNQTDDSQRREHLNDNNNSK